MAYVTRNRAGILDKILVKKLRKNENYSIVGSYKTEELKELGYTDKQILNMKKIALYDEILLMSNCYKNITEILILHYKQIKVLTIK